MRTILAIIITAQAVALAFMTPDWLRYRSMPVYQINNGGEALPVEYDREAFNRLLDQYAQKGGN